MTTIFNPIEAKVPRVVHKPWGHEEWLALNHAYAYKRIYIRAGFRTSLQYHRNKIETNYVVSGDVEVWLENDRGTLEMHCMKTGEFFTVLPQRRHRIRALSDAILQEVSSPEVDDVVRVQDDYDRGNGRIESEHATRVT
jgi:mannose-6-phosphate isomerase